MINSLKGRLLISGAAILIAFVMLTGITLEKVFRQNAIAVQQDRMRGLVFSLIGATDVLEDSTIVVNSEALIEPELLTPQGDITAALFNDKGLIVWKSLSYQEQVSFKPKLLNVDKWSFTNDEDGQGAFTVSFGFSWSTQEDASIPLTLTVWEDAARFNDRLESFRKTLTLWLTLISLILLTVMVAIFSWGLSPLKSCVEEIKKIQAGTKSAVDGQYPQELQTLIGALNSLLKYERDRRQRYQNALGDLAHSLKTPLTVLRGLINESQADTDKKKEIDNQVSQLNELVEYHLRRAGTAGAHSLTRQTNVLSAINGLMPVMERAYADKKVGCEVSIPSSLEVRVDKGDLTELFGNLLDNAFKFASSKLRVSSQQDRGKTTFIFDDDGPGFPEGASEAFFERGRRGNTNTDGQGIGLAVAKDILDAYNGGLRVARSDLGGAKVVITI